jgi:hypothetical protein
MRRILQTRSLGLAVGFFRNNSSLSGLAPPRSVAAMVRVNLLALSLGVAALLAPRAGADPVADVTKYSIFPQVDLSSLAGGKILAKPVPGLSGRDLMVQSVYVLRAPLAKAADLHKNWDAARHPELKVYVHHDFSTHVTPADFAQSVPGNGAVRKLDEATQKLPSMDDLQLSKAEAGAYKGTPRDFWSQILFKRASAYLGKGLSGLPGYDTSGGQIQPATEAARLLKEQPNVRALFRPIIEHSTLGGGAGSAPQAPYWELFDTSEGGIAGYSLGSASSVQGADSAQLLDLQFYASGGYYLYITLYQLWPVTVDGKPATLVWRVDAISTQSVADLGSFDRMGSGAAMSKEIQRMVNLFLRDSGQ